MFLRGGKNRIGAAVALAAVLAMALSTPAGAAPWGGWGEAREITSSFLPRVLVWLGLSPIPSAVLKCDGGSQIDPNGGCHKASSVSANCDDGMTIDPNGGGCHRVSGIPTSRTGGGRADDGLRVDLFHRR
jgi:hypothetical protein